MRMAHDLKSHAIAWGYIPGSRSGNMVNMAHVQLFMQHLATLQGGGVRVCALYLLIYMDGPR